MPKKNILKLHRKLIAVFLAGAFVILPFSFLSQPKQAEAFGFSAVTEVGPLLGITAGIATLQAAQYGTYTAKEFGLDTIAWFIAKVLLQKMTQSTVSWINSGFNGAPAFVSNPTAFFSNIGDQVAGQFILSDPSLNFLCSPFSTQLRIDLNNQRMQPFSNQIGCTLSGVVSNIDAFTSNFANGGWVAWNTMVTQPQNNPYGAYMSLTDEIQRREDQAAQAQQNELNWGNGFLSYTDANGNIQTPGSVIQNQLNQALGNGAQSLNAADEFNEIIGALMTQLTSHVLSSLSGGLRGVGNASGLNDGGADMRSLQDLQGPPQGTYIPSGNNGQGEYTLPGAGSYIQQYGNSYPGLSAEPTSTTYGIPSVQVPTATSSTSQTGSTSSTSTSDTATVGNCPGFNCSTDYGTGIHDAAGTACESTGMGYEFQACQSGTCGPPGSTGYQGYTDPTTGEQGQLVPVYANAGYQCGQCTMSYATCNNSDLQSCSMTFTQTTLNLCKS